MPLNQKYFFIEVLIKLILWYLAKMSVEFGINLFGSKMNCVHFNHINHVNCTKKIGGYNRRPPINS